MSVTRVVPGRPVGWWALAVSAVGLASWIVLPIITMTLRETYPITDTALMPVIGVVLVDVAAFFDVLCIAVWKERSLVNLAVAAVTVAAALFFTFMVVGEGLAGV